MPELCTIVTRAATRAPCPAAERSLATWRSLRVPDVRIADPAPTDGLLRVAPGEQWCTRCYESTVAFTGRDNDASAACPRCGHRRFVPAVTVLRPDEYYIAS